MPCPLCGGKDDPLIPNSCETCYPKFMAEKQAGVLPKIIRSGIGLNNNGFNAWRKGKCKQLAALNEGKSGDEAEAIGLKKMEESAQEELDGLARQQARIAKQRADLNRIFRHT